MTRQITALLYRAKEYVIGKAIPINADECLKMCRLINDLSDELESISKNTNNDAQAALDDTFWIDKARELWAEYMPKGYDDVLGVIERALAQQHISAGVDFGSKDSICCAIRRGDLFVSMFYDDEARDIINEIFLAQQQPNDETYQKLVHTQSDLEHSRTFAKDLSRQLDELKRECAAVKIELARIRKQQPVNAELLEALKAAKWKGEPSGNPEKGWVTTSSGQRFTSLGSRKMYGKFLEEHNKQIDYIIARAEQKGDMIETPAHQ